MISIYGSLKRDPCYGCYKGFLKKVGLLGRSFGPQVSLRARSCCESNSETPAPHAKPCTTHCAEVTGTAIGGGIRAFP